MRLRATTTTVDSKRTTRLLLAWAGGDLLAFDAVLAEAQADPTGVPGIVFSLADLAVRLGEHVDPDFADGLRLSLLQEEQDPGDSLGEN